MNFGGDHQRRPRRSMCHSQIYSASREGAWRWSVCFVPTIYCKTQQNSTLMGQERQGYAQLKVS